MRIGDKYCVAWCDNTNKVHCGEGSVVLTSVKEEFCYSKCMICGSFISASVSLMVDRIEVDMFS